MGSLIYYGALFLAKVLDNALSTTKTILIQRSRWLLAGIAVVLSDFIYFWLTKRTAIFLLGEKQTVSNGIKQDGSMAWMQHRPQMRIRPLFADTGILRMAIANTNTRGPSLEKMRTSLPIMVPELLP